MDRSSLRSDHLLSKASISGRGVCSRTPVVPRRHRRTLAQSRFVLRAEGGFEEGDSVPNRRRNTDDRNSRRTHYQWNDWVKHRGRGRYIRHIQSIPASGIFRSLLPPTLFFTSIAVLTGLYFTAQAAGYLLSFPVFNFGIVPFSLTGSALSFLLVFRTNTSYRRWLEARRMFGSVVTKSRDLYRQTLAAVESPELRAATHRWLLAFYWTLKSFVRPGEEDDAPVRLQAVMEKDELAQLVESPRNLRPHYCLNVLSRIIAQASLQPSLISMMDDNLSALYDALGSSERILGTPLPLAYTRHTSRFLMMWLFLLPWGLFHAIGWWAVAVETFISFLLLGVDEIGVSIEEPYSILALETFGKALEGSLKDFDRTFGLRPPKDAVFDFERRNRGMPTMGVPQNSSPSPVPIV